MVLHDGWRTVRSVQTSLLTVVRWAIGNACSHLDKVFTVSICDKRLQFGRGEGVDVARLRGDEEEHLRPRERGELVRLRA